MANCNGYIRKSIEFANELTFLADEGEAQSTDDGCALLYGVIRDCAYKIRAQAEREREAHQARGDWESEPAA
jgi:hypothetical protein